ncbi:MAG: hypothetical protein R3Y60_02365 [bacterium]
MNFYDDYLAFKEDKYELIEYLISNNSNIIIRFKHVLAVIDFIYERHCSNVRLTKDEEDIFQIGFNYIFDRFNLIELMLNKIFNDDKEQLEEFSRTINLILYVNDFKDEITNLDENNKKDLDEFSQYEETILELLENKEHATDVEFGLLNDISMRIFDELGEEYYGINEIFYDIALEYGIIDEDDVEELDVLL